MCATASMMVWLCLGAAAADPATVAREVADVAGVGRGFCVHVGATDGRLTVRLRRGRRFVVHALADRASSLDAIRAHIRSRDVYGPVSADVGSLAHLPYADGIANLVVVDDLPRALERGLALTEVVRILCPGGVACLGGPGLAADEVRATVAAAGIESCAVVTRSRPWARVTKARPTGADDWPQWRHDAARSQTSRDTIVGPPRHLKWIDGPRRSRHHKDGPGAVVAAGGRILAVRDAGPRFYLAPPRRFLVCRDAWNGLELWRRPLRPDPRERIPDPFPPAALCAVGDRVYVVLREGGRLLELDAATGNTKRTLAESPDRIAWTDGDLILSGGGNLRRVDLETGRRLWVSGIDGPNWIVAGDRVFALVSRIGEPGTIVCLGLATGAERWRATDDRLRGSAIRTAAFGAVLLGRLGRGSGVVQAVSTKDGAYLWDFSYRLPGHGGTPMNIFALDHLVWVRRRQTKDQADGDVRTVEPEAWIGLDPRTGRPARTIPVAVAQKCYPDAAADRFLICGTMDFVDVVAGRQRSSRAVRAVCGFGHLVANGLVYAFPNDCQCAPFLDGTMALSPGDDRTDTGWRTSDRIPGTRRRLERGPAWGATLSAPAADDDWPMYRQSPGRGGAITTAVPARLAQQWSAKVGGRLSAPSAAAGRVFVSDIDGHQVAALDAASGAVLWRFNTGGRVDLPPTYHRGLVLFGCRDGRVYCLRAADGALVWRFLAAPADRRTIAYGQPESVWPVSGSVPVRDGVVFFAAGRHTELDGGITLFALRADTGRVVWRATPTRPTYADILVAHDDRLFMRWLRIDPATGANEQVHPKRGRFFHAGGSSPFEDGTYAARTRWSDPYATGALLAFDGDRTVSVAALPNTMTRMKYAWTQPGKGHHRLSLTPHDRRRPGWQDRVVPIRPRAMALTRDTVFIAGPPDVVSPRGSALRGYDVADGDEQSALTLDARPVFDGLAAARGRLYLSLQDGSVRCFAGE